MIDLTGYDFVDFGSSKGGSMHYARKVFGGRGLGIDRDAERIALSRQAGLEIIEADLRYPTAFQGRVSYCTLHPFSGASAVSRRGGAVPLARPAPSPRTSASFASPGSTATRTWRLRA